MNLKKRLNDISQNNIAYVEAYGIRYYTEKHKELMNLNDSELEIEIEKLEQALETVNNRIAQEETNKKSQRTRALNKLKELGLTVKDLEALGL